MPAPKQLDPGQSPLHFFGSEFRRAREAASMSQGAFAAIVPCDISTVSRVEAGLLTPSDAYILATKTAFPELSWLIRFFAASRGWTNGPVPAWFEEWLIAERAALTLRYWQPIIIPGLFQTADYARALLLAGQTDTSEEAIEPQVAAKLARRAIFDKPVPPDVTVVLDEAVLHRLIGSSPVMYQQLTELAESAVRPYISVQVVPASNGANAGLGGALNIASGDSIADTIHMDAIEGQTTDRRNLVHKAVVAFDRVRGDALSRGQSRELILRLADELWKP